MTALQGSDLQGKPAGVPAGSEPTLGNWLSILVLGVIWGGTFMIVSLALDGYGPVTVAAARTGLGAVALLALAFVLRRPFPRSRAVWVMAVPIGILSSALPFFLLSWGQQFVPSAFAGLSMAALPLFVLPLAHVFAEERMQARKLIGVSLGFVGVLVLMGPGQDTGAASPNQTLGLAACVLASFCYAVSSILTRRCPPVDPVALSAMSLLIGAAVLVPAMLVVEGVPAWQPGIAGPAIVALGLVPTALAAVLRVQVIRTAGPVFMTLVNFMVPLWSAVLGALILSEVLGARFFAALALILTGLAISQWAGLRQIVSRGA